MVAIPRPSWLPRRTGARPAVTSNVRAFTVLVRNALFRRVELIARRRWWELGELDGDQGWGAAEWEAALADYFTEHGQVQVGANARGPALLIIDATGRHVAGAPDPRRPRG